MMRRWLFIFTLILCGSVSQFASAQQLSANFSATPTVGCVPIRVTFQDLSTGNPTGWLWNLGNGTTSNLQNPSTTYLTPGTYTITLIVYRAPDSSVMVKTNHIVVHPNPVVNFGATPLTGCAPQNVIFTDSSTAGSGTISTWQWDFGDGNIGSGQNPSHVYGSPGVFNVTLTVKNSNNCTKTLNKVNLISIFNSVNAGFTNTVPPTCLLPATVNFTNISTGPVTSYLWNFGDGTTSNLPNPSHTYTTANNFTVTLIVTSANGCSDTIVKPNIIQAGLVDANFTSPAQVCAGAGFSLQNTSAPAIALTGSFWDFGDGTTSTSNNPLKAYSSPGTYTIKLVSNFGLCSDSVTKTIIVLPKPTANFTGSNLFSCQAPLTASFTNTSIGGTVISWNFGDGTTSTATSPSHTYNNTGVYTVSLIVQNANGCYDTLVRPNYVVISPPQIGSISPLPVQGCVPKSVTFTPTMATSVPVVSYLWDFGDGSPTSNSANPTHIYTVQGTYTVKLTITDSTGCTSTITVPAGVKVGERPATNFSATPRIACAQDAINFTDLTPAPVPDEWFWQFGDGGTSTQQNPTYQYNDTGFFTVTLIVTRNGCKDTLKRPDYIYIKPPIARFNDSFSCVNQHMRYFVDKSLGALTYAWTFGDGTTSNIPSPNHLYADTGRYTVTLKVTNGTCQHEISKPIMVLDENAEFTITDSLGCHSTAKTFRAGGSARNIASYTWDFGEGNAPVTVSNPVTIHSFGSPGQYNVKLIITDLNGCTDTIVKPVTVIQIGPRANFGSAQQVCVRNLTTFTDSTRADATNPIVQWVWNFGDTTGWHNYTAPPFTHSYTTGGLYTVTMVAIDASGCRDTIQRVNTILIKDPKANFRSVDTLVCFGTQVNIADSSYGGTITSRFWTMGDGTTFSNVFTVQHIYGAEGAYDISLRVTDDFGCVDSIRKPLYIKVFNAKARFAMSDSFTTCPPLVVGLTNQSINAAISYWDFGDANTSTLANPSHTYTQSGVFTITLAVTGNGGCTDTLRKQIRILGPSGSLSYGPLNGCAPLTVTFNTVSQNANTFTFDYNDGTTQVGVGPTATHTYNFLGSYLPRLILSDTMGCVVPIYGNDSIRTRGVETYIKNLPKYVFCDSSTVTFQDSIVSNDAIQSFLWNFGDGTTSNLRTPSHFYNTPGNYRVTFTVTTVSGCSSTDTLNASIRVVSSPRIGLTGLTEGCVPVTVQFGGQWLNQDTTTVSWQWNFGNGDTSTQINPPSVLYSNAGTYNVLLIGRNNYGCTDTANHTVTVHALPNISAGPDKLICRGTRDTLTASGGSTYVWSPAAGLSCTTCPRPFTNPDSTIQYYVRGTDIHSCVNTDSVRITVKQPFRLNVGPGDTMCVGQTYQLNASGAENYLWQPSRFLNATNIRNPISRPDTTIRYRVVGYDSVGCFRDTGYITLQVFAIPRIDIVENQITLNVGDPVQLHSIASADVTRLRWAPTLNLSCIDCPNPISSPRQNITYTLTATNAGNCTAQDRVSITLLCKESNIFVPNTFSPNNDGANDVFYPRGKGLFSVKSMRVFNRWGELVFDKTNFLPNDPSAGWDGTQKGIALTPDVYVYMMEVICDNNVLYSVKGNVTLLR